MSSQEQPTENTRIVITNGTGILKKIFSQRTKKLVNFEHLQSTHIDLTSKTEQNKTDNGTAQKLHRSKTFSPVRKPGTPISPLCRSKSYSRKTPTEINRQVLFWQQEMSLKYPMYRYI